MEFAYYTVMTLFILVCFILMGLVLIQKGRGGGMSSAFGGGGGGSSAFGSKTGDVLTVVTSVVFALFILLAVGLNLIANKLNDQSMAPTNSNSSVPANNSHP